MKVTKKQLKQIIKEEMKSILKEEEIPPLVADAMDLIQYAFDHVTEKAKESGIQKEHLIAAVTRLIEIDYGQNSIEPDPHSMLETK